MDLSPVAIYYFPTAIFYPLFFFITSLVAIHFYIENLRIVRMGRKLPGPPTVPFFGNALIPLGVHPKDALYKLLQYESYGNVVRAFLGTKLVVFIIDPRDVEIILGSTTHIDKSAEYSFFAPWLGNGLLISTGEKWRTHRKLIAPTFHLNVLKTFVPLFYENSRDLVLRLRQEVGKEFDCHDHLAAVTVDILLETAMGVRGRKDKTGFDYAMAVMKMCDIIHRRQYDIRIRPDSLFTMSKDFKLQEKLLSIIHGLTSSVIRSRKREYEEKGTDNFPEEQREMELKGNSNSENINETKANNEKMRYVRDDLDEIDENDVGEKRRLAFLDMMLELARTGVNLTDEEIKEEVDTIMFEGHDTTAAGSSFVLCLLGIHQNIQAKVYEELDEIFKGSNRQCTYQDTLEMKYLERVIMETLRIFPPVPAIARHLNEDVKLASGNYVLPKDTTVVIPPFKIHRLPEYYPNPEVFDPDNFLPEKTQNRHYYAFIPFSAGPRSCVGRKYAMLKLKVLLSTILRNYRILSDLTEKDFRLKVDIILKRDDGFRIKIEPRNSKDVVTEVH
ncbi:cytochrome P450 4g15-like [Venturia canescens]|uniref:cytochrome P450 4g15-like n=1 Tax=Venturia canescens TaxID=32260 RepID=UPI001C9D2D76|nr:cytochrome P450 4g15-like [Venturia canescens]